MNQRMWAISWSCITRTNLRCSLRGERELKKRKMLYWLNCLVECLSCYMISKKKKANKVYYCNYMSLGYLCIYQTPLLKQDVRQGQF